MVIFVIDNPDIRKECNEHPEVQIVFSDAFIAAGEKYITHDVVWRLWKMSPERVPIPQGRFRTLNAAVFYSKK